MRTLLTLGVLAAVASPGLALTEIVTVSAYAHGATGGVFDGGWWFFAFYAMLTFSVIMSALKRDEPEHVIFEFSLYVAAATVLGQLTAAAARLLFCLPQLVDMRMTDTLWTDVTDETTAYELEENARAAAECLPAPYPCAKRTYHPRGVVMLGPAVLTFGVIVTVVAYYLLSGNYDGVLKNAESLGIALLVLGIIAVIAAVVDMLFFPSHARSHASNNRATIKYLIALSALLVLPVFYDLVLTTRPWVSGVIQALIYAVGWALFFAYATYAWSDSILYGKSRHAMWYAIIGFIPTGLGYIAGGIANDEYPGDAFAALVSQLVAAAVSVIVYAIIRFAGVYRGYALSAPVKMY